MPLSMSMRDPRPEAAARHRSLLLVVLLLPAWSQAETVVDDRGEAAGDAVAGEPAEGGGSEADSKVAIRGNYAKFGQCSHGVYDKDAGVCNCFEGWATAGITDTVDFLEGTCEQYRCVDDATCERVLGIKGAQCPVPNWNCYCGWQWAFANYGHGYETPERRGGGECMGVMYTFSVFATESTARVMSWVWMIFVGLAVLLLPFGRKRAICDHHYPSLWNCIRNLCGCQLECRGECVMQNTYTLDSFKDDVAWSLYVLDVGVWVYVFLFVLWAVAATIWCVVLWAVVAVTLIVAALCACCMACGEGCGECGNSCGTCGECGGCGDCLVMGAPASSPDLSLGQADMFYWAGPFPHDPYLGYGGCGGCNIGDDRGCESCDCCNCGRGCQRLCSPIAWLLFVFPVLPENAWGGLLGRYVLGTHALTPEESLYQGGNPITEFLRMGWRRHADLHSEDAWRTQVRNFILGEDPSAAEHGREEDGLLSAPRREAMEARRQWQVGSRFTAMNLDESARLRNTAALEANAGKVVSIGRARCIMLGREFDEQDNCVESSFADYEKNTCWICCGSNDKWDMWQSCHHLFCKACSTEMLQRRMPCPLCRVSSTTVLRGQNPHTAQAQ